MKKGLPASLARAWGIGSRPVKGPRPGLTLARIVDAAVTVAATEGVPAVSMSRIAAELGSAPMSLYRYVTAKDELLALMVDAAFAATPAKTRPRGWRRALSGWARAHLAVLRSNPWVLRIPLSGPPMLPNQMVWFERGIACFTGTRLGPREQISALLLVNGFVRNEALQALELEEAARSGGDASQQGMTAYGSLLRELVDGKAFPELTRLMDTGVFEGEEAPDAQFEFGLARILDGIGAAMPAR